ncbi:hypothetical protein S7711_08468 [Stachybotrys chartarum IBT 7711]|uniref:FAD-binding domain-containing protein n=1 Tax=Stachybotrys chartarum (strain CBS 109288 / IBT 7711) TaxID=1280523 RepID=A0A084AGH9_STACB|nr:hypothetical protein S7711_08468 [Stachybotrys chartarum IBT 7711]
MEPLLLKYASHHNFDIPFKTELIDASLLEDGTLSCTIKDLITMFDYKIYVEYLLGADGGRSAVAAAFPFTFTRAPSQAVACNIIFSADLSHLTKRREAQLYWILQPDTKSRFGQMPLIRAIRPWNQWMLIAITPGTEDESFLNLSPQTPGLNHYIKELIGDSTVDINIERVDSWAVRETVADRYSWGRNIHLLGDAAHRHPPAHGMGSNISVQDAYNRAWKVAYVSKGLAGPELLDSYTLERQPIGANLVKKSNDLFRVHVEAFQSLGLLATTPEEGLKQMNEIKESTVAGATRRELLYNGLEATGREGRNIGLTMNQCLVSKAIYLADEPFPQPLPRGDLITDVHVSPFPGSRLPHAWLGDTAAGRKEVSTQDRAGKGAFCLLTGHGGESWHRAAESIANKTGTPINHYGIGLGLDYYDRYRQWQRVREVNEDGCLLVRPDRVIAWRAIALASECEDKLLDVLNFVLSRA